MARNKMREKGEQSITAYRKALEENVDDLGRDIKRSLRDIRNRQVQSLIEEDLNEYLKDCKENGGRIPERFNPHWGGLPEAMKDHKKSLKKQSSLDREMLKELEPYRETYIKGLEYKQKILMDEQDEIAAAQIGEEIELTRKSISHFQEVIDCQVPAPTEEEE